MMRPNNPNAAGGQKRPVLSQGLSIAAGRERYVQAIATEFS